MNALTQLLAQSDETVETRKCSKCGELKSSTDYYKRKNDYNGQCKECERTAIIERRNTEIGYLKHRYDNMHRNLKTRKYGRKNKCLLTFDEFFAAWKKHKSIYGMKSAWGPGVNHLEQHLPITTITPGTKRANEKTPRIMANLSVDRLDSSKDYTIQNLIFIRNDENRRKNNTSYEDCKIQIRLHEERFGK